MGLNTIPQYLKKRFDGTTLTLVALFLVFLKYSELIKPQE